MHWSTALFAELHDALQECVLSDTPNNLEPLCRELSPDLRGLLATPPRSESSRKELASKQLTLSDGSIYSVSDTFINTAATVADEINCDEKVAAELVLNSQNDALSLDVSEEEAAIALFYVRRSYILELVRFATSQANNPEIRKLLSLFLAQDPYETVLEALSACEKTLCDLHDKDKRREFMGLAKGSPLGRLVTVQSEFVAKEHMALGCILGGLSRCGKASPQGLKGLMQRLAVSTAYSPLLLSYIGGFLEEIGSKSRIAHPQAPNGSDQAPDGSDQAPDGTGTALTGSLAHENRQSWKLPWLRGGLFVALHSTNPSESVAGHLRKAIDDGGIEFLMVLASDLSTPSLDPWFADLTACTRGRVQGLGDSANVVFPPLRQTINDGLCIVAEAVISNQAYLLRELRLAEEDAHLSGQPDRIGDLERFFLFVGHLYTESPDAALHFWEADSALNGFLVWGSQCQVSFISAAFVEMLSALSCGPEAAAAAHKFLSNPATSVQTPSGHDPVPEISYNGLAGIIRYYTRQLEPDQGRGREALSDDAILAVTAYLRLISAVAKHNLDSRERVWAEPDKDKDKSAKSFVATLFELLRVQTPLTGQILNTLKDVILPGKVPELFDLLDSWAFDKPIYGFDNVTLHAQGTARFDSILVALPDVMGFSLLLASLLEALDPYSVPCSKHLGDYATYIIGEVLVAARSTPSFTIADRTLLDICALRALKVFLLPLNGELARSIRLGASGRTSDALVANGRSVAEYLELFPARQAHALCFSDKVYNALFAIAGTSTLELAPLESEHPRVLEVQLAIEAITILIRDSLDSGRFEEPLLYNISIIPNLALHLGGNHLNLAIASINLLDLASTLSVFRATTTRRNRILSALESVVDSQAIRVGVRSLLEKPEYGNPDYLKTLFDAKVALLSFLQKDLSRSRVGTCVSHFLVGFTGDDNKALTITETPALETICDLLEVSLRLMRDDIGQGPARIAFLTTDIMLQLSKCKASHESLLSFIRKRETLLKLLKLEPIVTSQTTWAGSYLEQNPSAAATAAFVDFFRHRAGFSDLLTLEVHLTTNRGQLSLVKRYLNLLVNLTGGLSVLSFLDFMNFDLDTSTVDLESFFPKSVASALEPDRLLLTTQQDLETLLKLYRQSNSLDDLVMFQRKQNLLHAKLACLEGFCQLVPVLVRPGYSTTFVLETIQRLVPKLVDYSRISDAFCRPLASLLVLLLERYQDSPEAGDPSTVDRLHILFKAATASVQSSVSTPELRSDLYVVCYQSLKVSLDTNDERQQSQKLQTVFEAGDKLLQPLCWDALSSQPAQKLVALMLLQTLASLHRRCNSDFLDEALFRYNFLQLIVNSLESLDAAIMHARAAAGAQSTALLKVILALVLVIAQTRSGAERLLLCKTLDILGQLRVLEADQFPKHQDIMVMSFNVVVALLVSMGPDNQEVHNKIRSFLRRRDHLLMMSMRADAESHGLASDTALSQLADATVALVKLTGYVPNEHSAYLSLQKV